MSEDAVMVERVPDVELGAMVSRLTSHVELNAGRLEQAAITSDRTQQAGDYAGALAGAKSLLTGLVRDISYELRRSPNESVETFRARSRPAISVPRHSRFLVHKLFLSEREKETLQRAVAMTEMPSPDAAVSLPAWSRLARQMVYAVADQLLTRFAAWQAGCSCEAGGPTERIVFQPLGDGPDHERVICRRCHCPRQTAAATESPEAAASSDASPMVVRPTIKVSLIVAGDSDVEVWPNIKATPTGEPRES